MVRRRTRSDFSASLYASVSSVVASDYASAPSVVYGPQAAAQLPPPPRSAARCRSLLSGAALTAGLLVAFGVGAPQPAFAQAVADPGCSPVASSGTVTCGAQGGVYFKNDGNINVGVTGNVGPDGVYIHTEGAPGPGAYDINLHSDYTQAPVDFSNSSFDHRGNGIDTISNGGAITINTVGNGSGGGTVYGPKTGIYGGTTGYGTVSITTGTGSTITGPGGKTGAYGIRGSSTKGNVTIDSGSTVTATADAIYGGTGGTGAVSITSTGPLTADSNGIEGQNGAGTVTINAYNTIHADANTNESGDGIHARTTTGSISIYTSSAATIDGDAHYGIRALTAGGTNQGAGTVANYGNIAITANGDIGSSKNPISSSGIFAQLTTDSGPYGNLTIYGSANIYNDQSGRYAGIAAINYSYYGNTIVGNSDGKGGAFSGNVTNTNGDAIYAGGGGYVLVDTDPATLYATGNGIKATAYVQTACVFVKNGDNITGPGGYAGTDGIYALDAYTGGSGNVSVYGDGSIHATGDGIHALNKGAGGVYVGTAKNPYTGDITSKTGTGIYARDTNTQAAGDVTVYTDGDVTALANSAIGAVNNGTGDVVIGTGGNITAKGGDGIYAYAKGGAPLDGAAVTVTADPGILYATGNAITAKTAGTGDVTVTNDDTITGPGGYAGGYGIVAIITNTASSANVSVYGYGDIYAADGGIKAATKGTGGVYVGTGKNPFTGDITAQTGVGILAHDANSSATGNVTVYAYGGVTALAKAAIRAKNEGSGNVSVATGDGDITSNASYGIYAAASGGDVSVTTGTGAVYADTVAIHAVTDGSGKVTVSTGGDITSKGGDGIYAATRSGAISVKADPALLSATLYATGDGIHATTSGAITITNDDTITGPGGYAGGYGIYAVISNAKSTADVSV